MTPAVFMCVHNSVSNVTNYYFKVPVRGLTVLILFVTSFHCHHSYTWFICKLFALCIIFATQRKKGRDV